MDAAALAAFAPAPWHWMVLGFALVAIERVCAKPAVLAPAAAAWLTGLALLFAPLSLPAQGVMFTALSALALAAARLLRPRA